MNDIIISRDAVNLEALDADLRAALGDGVSGVSFSRSIVTVHLTDKAAPDASDIARQIVVSHDPAKFTAAQQQAQERAAKLDAARKANTANLDTSPFTDPLLAELAQKIAWLEQEILALRAGR
jgi:hypothetical protein